MRVAQLINPGAVWGQTATWDDQLVAEYQNLPTGTTRAVGDVVFLPAASVPAGYAVPQVDAAATANDKTVVGVVAEQNEGNIDQPSIGGVGTAGSSGKTYAAGAVMPVGVRGIFRINIAANVVARADILAASAVAGVAVTNNAATVGQAIAIALEASTAKDANNTIRAYIAKM
jgi:hypothetical protein